MLNPSGNGLCLDHPIDVWLYKLVGLSFWPSIGSVLGSWHIWKPLRNLWASLKAWQSLGNNKIISYFHDGYNKEEKKETWEVLRGRCRLCTEVHGSPPRLPSCNPGTNPSKILSFNNVSLKIFSFILIFPSIWSNMDSTTQPILAGFMALHDNSSRRAAYVPHPKFRVGSDPLIQTGSMKSLIT